MSLPAWATRAIDELHASDRQATAVARDLTVEQLNQPPAPGSWSVGQCLEHLVIANEVYLPPIAQALPSTGSGRAPSTGSGQAPSTSSGQAPSTGSGQARASRRVEEITPGWFSRYFIRNYIDPQTQRGRYKAPGKIAPPREVAPDILDRFLRSNDTARDLVRRASDFDVNRIRFKNPFVAGLRFTVGTGLEIVWRHQRRHLLQAERARAGVCS